MSLQDFGAFNGNKFTGNLLLPERYTEAIILGMLSKIFPDLRLEYEEEIKNLKHSREDVTQMRLSYNLGGLSAINYQSMEGVTDVPDQPLTTPARTIYFEIASTEDTATATVVGNSGDISVNRVDGAIVITSTTADFNNFTYINPNNDDCNYALDNSSQITIYPPGGIDLAVTIWNT